MDEAHDGVRQVDRVGVAGKGGQRPVPRWRGGAGWLLGLVFAGGLLGCLSGAAAAQRGPAAPDRPAASGASGSMECLRCHSLPNLGYRESAAAPVRNFTVPTSAYHSSAHGQLACRQCHTDIDGFPHIPSAQRRRVTCGQDCHAVDSAGRPYSHAGIVARYGESVHGRPVRSGPGAGRPDPDAPTCLTCHGGGDAHAIVPPAKLTRPEKMALCVDCHDNRQLMEKHRVPAEAVASYRRSFHYKAIRFGGSKTAICIDCHTAHHVLPAADSHSSVAPAALTKTCGQAGCHKGAGRNFAVSGANHLDLRVGRDPILWFEEKFFLVLTGGTMLMLLIGIVLDVQRKFGWLVLLRRLAHALGRRLERMRPSLARTGRRGLQLARQILID